jgi:predicted  nucleic acid-binding Zn-ribbon protein
VARLKAQLSASARALDDAEARAVRSEQALPPLQAEVQRLSTALAEATAELSKTKKEKSDLEAKVQTLTASSGSMATELAAIRQELAASRREGAIAAEAARGGGGLQSVQEEIAKIDARLTAAAQDGGEWKSEAGRLTAEVQKAKDAERNLRDVMESLRAEVERFTKAQEEARRRPPAAPSVRMDGGVVVGPIDSNSAEVSTPANATEIGERAFTQNEALQQLNGSPGITRIGKGAFQYCRALKSVSFGSGSALHSIGEFAFNCCASLERIEIPSAVAQIGNYAFANCKALRRVVLSGDRSKRPNFEKAFLYSDGGDARPKDLVIEYG